LHGRRQERYCAVRRGCSGTKQQAWLSDTWHYQSSLWKCRVLRWNIYLALFRALLVILLMHAGGYEARTSCLRLREDSSGSVDRGAGCDDRSYLALLCIVPLLYITCCWRVTAAMICRAASHFVLCTANDDVVDVESAHQYDREDVPW
jgi:hypothetical protein